MEKYILNKEVQIIDSNNCICIELNNKLFMVKSDSTILSMRLFLKNIGIGVEFEKKELDTYFTEEMQKEFLDNGIFKENDNIKVENIYNIFNKLKKVYYVNSVTEKDIENELEVVLVASIQDYKKLKSINDYCRKTKINVVNIIAMNPREIILTGFLYKEKKDVCFDCFINRMIMNSKYFKRKLECICSIENDCYKNTNILCESNLIDLVNENIDDILSDANKKCIVLNYADNKWSVLEKGLLLKVENCRNCVDVIDNNNIPIVDAVSEKVGIIKGVDSKEVEIEGNKSYVAISYSTDFSYLNKLLPEIANSGAGFDEESAINAAIGETLERYASAMQDKNIIVESYDEMVNRKLEAIQPEKFDLFSDEQYNTPSFPYKKFDNSTKVGWVSCKEFGKDEDIYVPAAFVYLPYIRKEKEEAITPYISTGLAAHTNYEEAVLSGIYEILERDAFSLSWLNKIPPMKMPAKYEYDGGEKLKQYCYEITLDIPIHTVVSVMEGEIDGKNILSIGAATRYELSEAYKKATIESLQGRNYVYDLVDYFKDIELTNDFKNIDTFQKHAMFYSKFPEMRKEVNYLVNGVENVYRESKPIDEENITDIREKLNKVVKIINEQGYKVYVKDITPSDLDKLNICVVRVIIPGLHGLHGTHNYRYLGGKRMKKFNEKYCNNNGNTFNVYPHPFP